MAGMSTIDWIVGGGNLSLDAIDDRSESEDDHPNGAIRDACVSGHAPGDRGCQNDVGAVRG